MMKKPPGNARLLGLMFLLLMPAAAVAEDEAPSVNSEFAATQGDIQDSDTYEKSETFLNCGEPYTKREHDAKCLLTNTRDGTAEYKCWKYPEKKDGGWQCVEKCTFVKCCRPGGTC